MKLPCPIGILGCGAIAPAYLQNLGTVFNRVARVDACADLDQALARDRAEEFGIPRVLSPEELLRDESIPVIVNLTPAPVHYVTNRSILEAGKHVYTEKPLCLGLAEARELVAEAERRKLVLAGAADTFLGAGHQVARQILDAGTIGTPLGATAVWTVGMYDSERYHSIFNGALLDLGPYYLTALVQLLGPVARVHGQAEIRFPQRTDPSSGRDFTLQRPSTAAAILKFASGAVATIFASQDVGGYYPRLEVFGTKGRLCVPDANMYSGTLRHDGPNGEQTVTPGTAEGFVGDGRGLGLAEMLDAIADGRSPRAGARLLLHVLEVALAVYTSAKSGAVVPIESRVDPAPTISPSTVASYHAS